jgi:hypothetical protein
MFNCQLSDICLNLMRLLLSKIIKIIHLNCFFIYLYIMIEVSKNILYQISSLLLKMNNDEYTLSLKIFSGSSVAQHVRHTLEFYLCLLDSQAKVVNFDKRERNPKIENDLNFTLSTISNIISRLGTLSEDKPMILEGVLGGELQSTNTSMHRELLYVIEHAVHHMAIIKIGFALNFPEIQIPENFGVAESTITYRKECVQ